MEHNELNRLLNLEEWNSEDEKIALNLEENQRVHLAKHIEKYDGIIIDLSHDRSDAVREAVASNVNTPIDILRSLSISDKCKTVRDISNSTLKELSK